MAAEQALVDDLRQAGWSLRRSLSVIGLSRSSWHYRSHPRPGIASPTPHRGRAYPNRVGEQDQQRIIGLLRSAAQQGISAYQAWFDALDAGDPVASLSTWYRIARAERIRCTTARRSRKRSSAMPQWHATGPNQVWCWDITKLPGRYKGQWFNLYAVIDVFSRRIMAWRVEDCEDDQLAADMFTTAFTTHGVHPRIVHSDGGPSMMSDELARVFRAMGITRSRNRPRVSNDNPHMESWFKTAKYHRDWPGYFTDLDAARSWAARRVTDYNQHHAHSSLAGHTPQSVHDGTWHQVHHRRQATLEALAHRYPQRFTQPPHLATPPAHAWLNPDGILDEQTRRECLHTG
ncbi:MAG: IS3 family transposase [Luteococcus japonicus]